MVLSLNEMLTEAYWRASDDFTRIRRIFGGQMKLQLQSVSMSNRARDYGIELKNQLKEMPSLLQFPEKNCTVKSLIRKGFPTFFWLNSVRNKAKAFFSNEVYQIGLPLLFIKMNYIRIVYSGSGTRENLSCKPFRRPFSRRIFIYWAGNVKSPLTAESCFRITKYVGSQFQMAVTIRRIRHLRKLEFQY